MLNFLEGVFIIVSSLCFSLHFGGGAWKGFMESHAVSENPRISVRTRNMRATIACTGDDRSGCGSELFVFCELGIAFDTTC